MSKNRLFTHAWKLRLWPLFLLFLAFAAEGASPTCLLKSLKESLPARDEILPWTLMHIKKTGQSMGFTISDVLKNPTHAFLQDIPVEERNHLDWPRSLTIEPWSDTIQIIGRGTGWFVLTKRPTILTIGAVWWLCHKYVPDSQTLASKLERNCFLVAPTVAEELERLHHEAKEKLKQSSSREKLIDQAGVFSMAVVQNYRAEIENHIKSHPGKIDWSQVSLYGHPIQQMSYDELLEVAKKHQAFVDDWFAHPEDGISKIPKTKEMRKWHVLESDEEEKALDLDARKAYAETLHEILHDISEGETFQSIFDSKLKDLLEADERFSDRTDPAKIVARMQILQPEISFGTYNELGLLLSASRSTEVYLDVIFHSGLPNFSLDHQLEFLAFTAMAQERIKKEKHGF